ncbi:AI-2E family transporter [Weissella coleopterorum]|uniref:AI-2E family transporter n=1 Tax=Weissella coleopterorum TaxID=2714949 RepID=A0A6G8AYI5_9LACO|nr:AI-2E family transporter [Weissella coleopterorum]QIL50025.1 AI-2E family transporter [Weissella coleopterorum]
MLEKIRSKSILFWSLELLIIALLLMVVSQLDFILEPIFKFIGAVFIPVLISGLLYYILNPIIKIIEKVKITKEKHIPRSLIALFLVVLMMFLIGLAIAVVVPRLVDQITNFVQSAPTYLRQMQHWMESQDRLELVNRMGVTMDANTLQRGVQKYGTQIANGMANGIGGFASSLIGYLVYALTVPVMTFYMLSDGNKLLPFVQKWFPKRKDDMAEVAELLNDTLSNYIMGQVMEMLFVGFATGIGYFLIGEKYALVLAIIAGLANIVPYLGPYIGIIPALFVSVTQGIWQVVFTIVVVAIVHLIDGNIIYPRIIGSRLNIHPMTIIVLLLAAGNVAGAPGMILVIPTYAILRTLFVYLWEFFVNRQEQVETSSQPKV